jgi:hypothetical protein
MEQQRLTVEASSQTCPAQGGRDDTPRFEELETEVLDYIAGMTDTDPDDL